jgi:hypothetical protein
MKTISKWFVGILFASISMLGQINIEKNNVNTMGLNVSLSLSINKSLANSPPKCTPGPMQECMGVTGSSPGALPVIRKDGGTGGIVGGGGSAGGGGGSGSAPDSKEALRRQKFQCHREASYLLNGCLAASAAAGATSVLECNKLRFQKPKSICLASVSVATIVTTMFCSNLHADVTYQCNILPE